MAFRTWLMAAACGFVLASAARANASQILTSFSYFQGGGFSPCPQIGPVEFYVGIDGPAPLYYTPIGRGLVTWSDGESGTLDITPSNEPLFPELASRLTNGLDDAFYMLDDMPGCNGGYNGGVGGPESLFFPPPGDLAGNQLDFIRLYVSNVNIEVLDPTIQWIAWTADVTYEFWGTPLPEPAMALPLLCASLLFRRKARSRRNQRLA
jgi:hypothetical protein